MTDSHKSASGAGPTLNTAQALTTPALSTPTAPIDPRLAAFNANIEAANNNPMVSPATGKPFTKTYIARFSIGFLVFGIMWILGLGIVASVLMPEHLKHVDGASPEALLGIVNAFSAIASLVSNLIFGNFSDRTRSKWGRRTPWVFFGAVLGGVSLFLSGVTTNPVIITICYCLCMGGLNAMIAPITAIISDRVPSGLRATISGCFGAGGTIGASVGSMIGARFINNIFVGFALAGFFMFLAGIVTMFIIPKEGTAEYLPKAKGSFGDIVRSFTPPSFSTSHDFYKAFAGRFCMLVSYQMIFAYQLYILQRYIGLSVDDSAAAITVMSTIVLVVSVIGATLSGPISDILKRRKLPVIVATVLYAVGIAMPWVMPSLQGMYLFAGIAGLGYAVYSAVDQALLVDVLPNKENAGKDLGILNLATTAGQMLGPIIMSTVSVRFGYAYAFPISIVMALIGCVFIQMIKNVR